MQNGKSIRETTVAALGEFGLLEALTAAGRCLIPGNCIGPGDDCAVVPLSHLGADAHGGFLLLTVDSLVSGTHFSVEHSSLFQIGCKSLAVSLSDIAAMGGTPIAALISLHLPPDTAAGSVIELNEGINATCRKYGCAVFGGDIVSSSELAISVSLVGFIQFRPALRSAAVVGDGIWVSGTIGSAHAGLLAVQKGANSTRLIDTLATCIERHCRPEPRLRLGQELVSRGLVHAMIDISDGLIQDAEHIAKASSVVVEIWPEVVPILPAVLESGVSRREALTGGDDYELLFTVAAELEDELCQLKEQGHSFTKIGRISPALAEGTGAVAVRLGTGELITKDEYLGGLSGGYCHFG